MTRKGKAVFIVVILIALLLKEEIYGFLFVMTPISKIENNVCELKNTNLEKKYQELESAYQYSDKLPFTLEHSKVLYRNIYDLTNHITIYKGSKNNIEVDNLVINEDGLVGMVSKVNKESCEVTLLKNKDLNLSVKINDEYGVLKYEDNTFVIKGINNQGKVLQGDKVYTSDISIYPEDVFIGVVSDVYNDNYEIEKIIKVEASVHFDSLKYLSIIVNLRGQE